MTTVSERIRALVGNGKLSSAEGERLLGVSGEPVEHMSPWNLFHRFGGGRAALVGLASAAAGIALTRFGVRYDGFLDLHIVPTASPLRTALLEQALV